jgi:biotin carboxylase
MTKTLLIIGAGPLQLPAYREARQMGLRIVAIDRNPGAPGMALADAAHVVDTRDAKGAIRVAREENVDAVMTLCTDYPVRTVAAVAQSLGLCGLDPDTAARATHKGLMRETFLLARAPSPDFRHVRDVGGARQAIEALGLPAIIKPTGSSGSRGVFKITDAAQIDAAFMHASSIEGLGVELVVERFIDGPEVSVEVVSWRGEHHVIAITDKLTTGDPHWVEMGHSQPTVLNDDIKPAIVAATRAGLDALGARDGTAHAELRMAPGGPMLIEIGLRLGGDFIATELTRRSTGVNMVRAAIDVALGRQPDVAPSLVRGAAVRYVSHSPGRVMEVSGLQAALSQPGVEIADVYVRAGDEIGSIRSSLDRIGHVIATGENAAEAVQRAENAARFIRVETAQAART